MVVALEQLVLSTKKWTWIVTLETAMGKFIFVAVSVYQNLRLNAIVSLNHARIHLAVFCG